MFILEKEILKVKNPRIKPLLEEVLSSYYNGNYRSAVVVNYTAVIMDLLDKVSDLSNIHQDPAAKKISKEINNQRQVNNKSPKWEWELIKEISNQTELIDIYELADLEFVKTQRNYAAHPIVKHDEDEWSMKEITKETCIDIIRKSYEIVFLKQPILSRQITMDIVEFTFKTINTPGMTDNNVELVLKEKYFKYLSNDVKDRLIKMLYKFIFSSEYENQNYNNYRWSNLKLLIILLKEDTGHVIDVLSDSKIEELILPVETSASLYEKVGGNNYGYGKVNSLLLLISHVPKIKERINPATIENLRFSVVHFYEGYDVIARDIYFHNAINLRSEAILSDPETHLESMLDPILCLNPITPRLSDLDVLTLDLLYNQFIYYSNHSMFVDYVIFHFTDSRSFDQAETDMQRIPWLFSKMDKQQFWNLLFRINNNSQFTANRYLTEFFNKLDAEYKNMYDVSLLNTHYALLFNNIILFEAKPDLAKEEIKELLSILDKNEIVNKLQYDELVAHYDHIICKEEYTSIGLEMMQGFDNLKSKLNL